MSERSAIGEAHPGVARLLLAALLACLAVALSAPAARADGDPASDVLISSDTFFPYSPTVSSNLASALQSETVAARAAGFPVKVALIDSTGDLGSATVLFGKPQEYATFLEQEIVELASHRLLLVVMPSGYGLAGADSAQARRALAGLSPPAGAGSDELARAAAVALPKLVAAAGHPLRDVPSLPAATAGTSASSAGTSPASGAVVIAALAVGAVVIAGAILVLRRRARRP